MKRKFVSIMTLMSTLSVAVLSGCGKSDAGAKAGSAGELYVYNWGEYIDESVVEEFEKETGIKVVYDMFETNEEMYPVLEAGGVVYDVVCPSDYMIEKMIQNDMLAEIDFNNVPNIKNIDTKYMNMAKSFDPENKYAVPYTWGTVGILYNTSMVDDEITSWSDLWNPKYQGNILMQDSVRDAFMVGEKMLGYSMNTIEQKPLVQAYVIDQVRDKMIGGEAAIGVIYSGEMLYVQNEVANSGEDFELKYVIPKEGTNLWIDAWVIPKNAKNKENAEKWIDFLNRPEIAKKNFEYITYPTPNKAAFELLDKELQENTALFPTDDMLKNSEVFKYLGDEGDSLYNDLWKEVKGK